MAKIILLTGGVRSGKSAFALELAKKLHTRPVFVATCQPLDDEMRSRIRKHRTSRPRHWKTIEEPLDLTAAFRRMGRTTKVAVVDCLTLLISNLMHAGAGEKKILQNIRDLVSYLKKRDMTAIFVTNEVGWGIVPANKLAREFRDLSGKMNQLMAGASDEVYLLVSGLPVKIKDGQQAVRHH
jgi:adenosylcobinamide kinase/adenosylcobinamide-phosphate guanylyltransferase